MRRRLDLRGVVAFGALASLFAFACSQTQDVGFTDPDPDGGPGGSADDGGPSVVCEGGLSACGATCLDLTKDSANCGRCGRACAGCDAGMCPTATLFSADGFGERLDRLLVDDDALYWTSNSCVSRANKDGSAASPIDCPSSPPDGHFVMDAAHLYWASSTSKTSGSIFVAMKGESTSTTLLDLPSFRPFGLAIDAAAQTLFFGNLGAGQDPATNPSLLGYTSVTAPSAKTLGSAPVRFFGGIAVTPNAVLVTVSDSGSLMQLSRPDGTRKTLATGFINPIAVLVEGADAYVVDAGQDVGPEPGSIVRVPLAGGKAVPIATGLASPAGIAIDAEYIYFTTLGTSVNGYNDGAVMRVSKSRGSVLPLAMNEPAPGSIGVDGSFVYWADHGTQNRPSAIVRTPR